MAEHGYEPYQSGIRVVKFGPWKTEDGSWQYDFVPIPTDWCDLCADRIAQGGGRPSCVRHCQYGVISCGEVDELTESFKTKQKMMLISPRRSGGGGS